MGQLTALREQLAHPGYVLCSPQAPAAVKGSVVSNRPWTPKPAAQKALRVFAPPWTMWS